ncbi:MAG: hypothetical protein M0Z80_10570 [Treponema sp.]|nr:hypothetical protein [Treponema sp.]
MSEPDSAALAVLQGELEQDLAAVPPLVDENRRAAARIESGARDSLDYAALGYTIHNLYCLMENSFFRIAKTFENNLGDAGWHRELLERMLVAVPGIRPAILTADRLAYIDELRAFRHVFRNIYRTSLKPTKVMIAQASVEPACEAFGKAISDFIATLAAARH